MMYQKIARLQDEIFRKIIKRNQLVNKMDIVRFHLEHNERLGSLRKASYYRIELETLKARLLELDLALREDKATWDSFSKESA